MASTAPSPTVPEPAPTDLVTLTEASALFAQTGYEVDPRKLKRWALKHGVTVRPSGRDLVASWSDLLEVHAREVDRMDGRR